MMGTENFFTSNRNPRNHFKKSVLENLGLYEITKMTK